MSEIVEIKGVGPVLAKAFAGNGYGSVEQIAKAMVVELVAVPGVSEIRAKQLIGAAKSLLNGASVPDAVVKVDVEVKSETSAAKKSKPKKKKNEKKKDKKSKNKKKSDKKKNNKKNKKKSKKGK